MSASETSRGSMNLNRSYFRNTASTTNGQGSNIDITALNNFYRTSESYRRLPTGAIDHDIKNKMEGISNFFVPIHTLLDKCFMN